MNSTEIIDAVAGMPQHRVGADNNEFDMDQDNFMEDLLYSGLMLGQDLTTDAPPADASQQEEPLTASVDRCLAHTALHTFTIVDAFEVLHTAWESAQGKDLNAASNNALLQLSVRRTASPIDPSVQAFLVDKRSLARDGRGFVSQQTGDEKLDPIEAKFQGFGNGEVWWNPRHNGYIGDVKSECNDYIIDESSGGNGCFGVVMRRMVRQTKNESAQVQFVGCQYSLVRKEQGAENTIAASEIRKLVVTGAPSLVKFWRERDLGKPSPTPSTSQQQQQKQEQQQQQQQQHQQEVLPSQTSKRQRILSDEDDTRSDTSGLLAYSCGSSSSARSESSHSVETDVSWQHSNSSVSSGGSSSSTSSDEMIETKTGMRLRKLRDGTYELLGDLTVRGSVKVDGGLSVTKGIQGQLITPPDACDYAEWFELFNPDTEKILPGHVVQLRSPQQRVTLDTSGCGPIMVVSTKPSVAAGVPTDPIKAKRGVLCAFVGQAPVRVQGTVRVGDPLVPSGLGDGHALTAFFRWGDVGVQPLGTAMEDFITPGIEECQQYSWLELAESMIRRDSWLEHAQSMIMGKRRTATCIPEDSPVGLVNTLVRWQHNGRWESAKQFQSDVFQAWATVYNLCTLDVLMLIIQIGFIRDQGAIILRVVTLGLAGYTYHHFYPHYKSYAESDMYMFFMVSLVNLVYHVLDTSTVLTHANRSTSANGAAPAGINWNAIEWPLGYVRIVYTLVICARETRAFAFSMKIKGQEMRYREMILSRSSEVEVQRELVPSTPPHIMKKTQ